jgi:hypothetical protein
MAADGDFYVAADRRPPHRRSKVPPAESETDFVCRAVGHSSGR